MKKVKVAAIGSCVTRDNFNSMIVPDYKEFYEMIYYQHQISFISLMSSPIGYCPNEIKNIKSHEKRHLETELEKSFFQTMIINQPEYLIIDLYGDVFHGVIEVEDSYLTHRPNLFSKTDIYKRLNKGRIISLYNDSKTFLKIWKEAVNNFFLFLKKYAPNCKVILNKARASNEYFDENNKRVKVSDNDSVKSIDVDLHNFWWKRLDKYIYENFDVDSLDYENYQYLASLNHPWKLLYVHYEEKFYEDFTKKLREKIERNQASKILSKKSISPKNNNLVINSNFIKGKEFWYHWHDDFKLIDENIVSINKSDLQSDINRQIWSNTIEVHTDGKKEFTISFEIKVDSIKDIDSYGTVFSIRLFNQPYHLSQSEAVWFKPIMVKYLKDLNNQEWLKFESTVRPPRGKFMRVGPYLHRNGNVQWRNIKVELGKETTPWSPSFNGL